MSEIKRMLQSHKLSCESRQGEYPCTCGRDAAESELAAMQARIEKLENVAEKLANIIQWAMDDEEDFTYSAEGMVAIAALEAEKITEDQYWAYIRGLAGEPAEG